MNEPIITINVITYESAELKALDASVVMIPFSAKATGSYFTGETIQNGVDTQIGTKDSYSLSARYMLEGEDFEGQKCRVFIENNGSSLESCVPKIYTDSKALSFLHTASLFAKVECVEDGVIVRIYMNDN